MTNDDSISASLAQAVLCRCKPAVSIGVDRASGNGIERNAPAARPRPFDRIRALRTRLRVPANVTMKAREGQLDTGRGARIGVEEAIFCAHKSLDRIDDIRGFSPVIVAAGMGAAPPSVLGRLIAGLIIAVRTGRDPCVRERRQSFRGHRARRLVFVWLCHSETFATATSRASVSAA